MAVGDFLPIESAPAGKIGSIAEPWAEVITSLLRCANFTDGTISRTLAQLAATNQDYLDFNPQPETAPAYVRGRVAFDDTDDSLIYFNQFSGRRVNVAQEHYIRVRNNSGSTIFDGQVARVTGVSMDRPAVAKAQADTVANSKVIGVATMDITDASFGDVVKLGLLHGLNTSGFSAGNRLYLSASTPGALTNVAPGIAIFIGYCIVSDATQGIILVDTESSVSTRALTDISESAPADGSILRFDTADSKYHPETFNPPPGTWTLVASGTTSLAATTTTTLATITGVLDGEVLLPILSIRTNQAVQYYQGDASANPPTGDLVFEMQKTTNDNEHLLRARHNATGTIDLDFRVYKVS